ncbi:BLUF domain-containing protein [Dyadobacter crusticola]|uniref:BLUF domain-containing protein n=1 Tax=Dyadobacter crusticola TaxID=292407 RepID=UPI00068FCD53|nr:BLUF domain-containing protein [Dyadobacter crusticola]
MIHSIVYLSSSRTLVDEPELSGILEKSRKNNASLNITGALLYCNGSIIQVLEGPEDTVNLLFDKIKNDQRHTQIITLFEGKVNARSFEKWSMGYITTNKRNMDELKDQLGFVNNPYIDTKIDNKILSLLQTFFRNNHRN